MMKYTYALWMTFALFYGCYTIPKTETRKDKINEFISAVKLNDTNAIYSIVDTSAYFEIQDKNHLRFQIHFLKGKFIEYGSRIIDNKIKITRRNIPFTDYTYVFCNDAKEEIFKIKFTFSDFKNKNKINYIEIDNLISNVRPTLPPISQ